MDLAKEYVTGAKVYKQSLGWKPRIVGFDDCESCGGKGYIDAQKNMWSYRNILFPEVKQCEVCALRHGSTEFYNPRMIYKGIERAVKAKIKINARGKLTDDQIRQIEQFQDSDLARAYRKLLRDVWGWTEPKEVTA